MNADENLRSSVFSFGARHRGEGWRIVVRRVGISKGFTVAGCPDNSSICSEGAANRFEMWKRVVTNAYWISGQKDT